MEDNKPEKYVKLILLGDSSVGKTSLASRFCHEEFGRQYYPTAGVDFFMKRTVLQGNKLVRAVVWDLGGQSLDGSMFQYYLYKTQAILLVFDITNASSFTRLNEWMAAASKFIFGKPPLVVLVANKIRCDENYIRLRLRLAFSAISMYGCFSSLSMALHFSPASQILDWEEMLSPE